MIGNLQTPEKSNGQPKGILILTETPPANGSKYAIATNSWNWKIILSKVLDN